MQWSADTWYDTNMNGTYMSIRENFKFQGTTRPRYFNKKINLNSKLKPKKKLWTKTQKEKNKRKT